MQPGYNEARHTIVHLPDHVEAVRRNDKKDRAVSGYKRYVAECNWAKEYFEELRYFVGEAAKKYGVKLKLINAEKNEKTLNYQFEKNVTYEPQQFAVAEKCFFYGQYGCSNDQMLKDSTLTKESIAEQLRLLNLIVFKLQAAIYIIETSLKENND